MLPVRSVFAVVQGVEWLFSGVCAEADGSAGERAAVRRHGESADRGQPPGRGKLPGLRL